MKRWINVLAQIALGAGQVVAVAAPVMDTEMKVYTATSIAALQLVVSALAHGYNPDGTSAREAYEPPRKETP